VGTHHQMSHWERRGYNNNQKVSRVFLEWLPTYSGVSLSEIYPDDLITRPFHMLAVIAMVHLRKAFFTVFKRVSVFGQIFGLDFPYYDSPFIPDRICRNTKFGVSFPG